MLRQPDLFTRNTYPLERRIDENGKPLVTREGIEYDLGVIEAETWPPRHNFHKYWGKKPANIVSQYVRYFSSEEEIICDPFCGSGVTAVESLIAGRSFVGYDLNPFAVRHAKALLSPPDLLTFERATDLILSNLSNEALMLFCTKCRVCGNIAEIRSCAYETDKDNVNNMYEVRYKCLSCGTRSDSPNDEDYVRALERYTAPEATPDAEIFYGWQMRKLRKKSVTRWSELFTSRSFRLAGLIRQEVMEIDDMRTREWLLLTLTASLAQFTRMIADFSGAAGGPSWKLNSYWLPKRWQELNPLKYFENRVRKSVSAIKDLHTFGAPFSQKSIIDVHDSRILPLDDGSIDYIFTDPPYGGEGIQYGELSMLWCLWLGEKQDLTREIAFNPVRSFTAEHYAEGLRQSFSEAYRVLKAGRSMTVTFANKDPEVWEAFMTSCRSAGFDLVAAVPMVRSAPSLTETNMEQAPKADLILTFSKPSSVKKSGIEQSINNFDIEQTATSLAKKLLEKDGTINLDRLYEMITIEWLSKYYEGEIRPDVTKPTFRTIKKIVETAKLS